MKKLLLINPVSRRSGLLLSRFSTFAPLGLAYVAAVTPSNWTVRIADENMKAFKFEEADLVGITAFTTNINRAYEIARMYRKRNIRVIIGGIHASMLPEEILHHADSVVVGEVEGIWQKVLKDFESNRLQQRYIGSRVNLAESVVKPRRELLHSNYFWHSVQTSRGCPFNCSFCSVSKYLGKEFRQRKVLDVLAELADINDKYIAFVDDNLVGHSPQSEQRALDLFEGMLERNLDKRWWMQTSINAAENEKLLEKAAHAGCMFAFIGFETLDKNALKTMGKGINIKIGVRNYKRVVDKFHKYGIAVYGAFILGNDYESPAYYEQMAQFLVNSGIDIIQLTLLTPLPGTELMQQLENEGRLVFHDFPQDWEKYRFSYIVHQPKGVTPAVIYTGNNYIKHQIYSFPNYLYRITKSLLNLKNTANFVATYKFNNALKKGWRNSHYFQNYSIDFE